MVRRLHQKAWHFIALQSLAIALWLDPRTSAQSSTSTSTSDDLSNCNGDVAYVGDGGCDTSLDNAACNYDGGDCCECTCQDGDGSVCGERGGGFYCLDPDAPCEQVSDVDLSECTGDVDYIEDGLCDYSNNNAACGYDGGDCCECTCKEGLANPCGERGGGIFCIDPDAPCEKAANATTPAPAAGPSTAAPTASSTSSNFPGCTGSIPFINDGHCDAVNNNDECGYDGGDCCECTCGAKFGCGVDGFDCLDPNVSADCHPTPNPWPSYTSSPYGGYYDDTLYTYYYDDSFLMTSVTSTSMSSMTSGSSPCDSSLVSNGDCNEENNSEKNGDCNEENNSENCQYDGGDCCWCTCEDDAYTCGGSEYVCIDPDAECTETSESWMTLFIVGWILVAIAGVLVIGGAVLAAVVFGSRARKARKAVPATAPPPPKPANPPAVADTTVPLPPASSGNTESITNAVPPTNAGESKSAERDVP